MTKKNKMIQASMALVLIISLLAPAAMTASSARSGVQPALHALASDRPDRAVRVIVQKSGSGLQAETLIAQLGGQVLKDLPIINAVAAELPARAALELAGTESVRWVALDTPVVSSGKPRPTASFTLLDTFSQASFANNDGLASWTTEWIEHDVAGSGPTAGNIWISTSELFKCDLGGYCMVSTSAGGELRLSDNPDTGTQPSIEREADLSDGVTSASLSYTFKLGSGVDLNEDLIVFEVSTDGGASYTLLDTLNFKAGASGSMLKNILPYASAHTRFRFRVQSGYEGADEFIVVDDFKIDYVGNALPKSTYLDTLGVRQVWELGYTGAGIGVAVIDSGISTDRDFLSLQRVSFNSSSTTVNDVYGHGTHVAGIIGGRGIDSGGYYMGLAPDATLIGLKISDENGMAYESDTVEAMQWVLDNKEQYNIRVVNLSIQSAAESSYHLSPMDAAAEILWFNGIVVVAAAGNWDSTGFNPIHAAPANDPFVITVGAVNEKGDSSRKNDVMASFSAYDETQEHILKPEILAPGKDIISVLSKDSPWDIQHPDRSVFSGQYFRISGTSMAAPMVSGAAALLLQAEPHLTPDQVKYRLTHTASSMRTSVYLDVYAALTTPTTESANTGMAASQLLWTGDNPVSWDSVSWNSVNWNAVNWNAVNWNAVNWNAVNWNAVNWGD